MLRRTFTILALTLALAVPALAQECDQPEIWRENIRTQTDRLLSSPNPLTRQQILQVTLALTHQGCFAGRTTDIAGPLLSTYKYDDDEDIRLLAAVVINALDDDYAKSRVRELAGEVDSKTLRRATLALLDYDASLSEATR